MTIFLRIKLDALEDTVQLHFDVYYDYSSTARLTKVTREMGKYQAMIGQLEGVIESRHQYGMYLAFALLMTVLQTLKDLDFHPQFGIVTKTVRQALSDLCFFFALFFLVVTIYSFLGVIVFGSVSEDFRRFDSAFTANIYVRPSLLIIFYSLILGLINACTSVFNELSRCSWEYTNPKKTWTSRSSQKQQMPIIGAIWLFHFLFCSTRCSQ